MARLTLNRPDRLNAFDAAMHTALKSAFVVIEPQCCADGSVRAVIVGGAGRAFSAGQDLAERAEQLKQGEVDLHASLEDNYNPLVRRIAALPVPVIAAVNGVASGAGAGLALACDIVLAARSARFQFPFVRVGLGPDTGTSWSLTRRVGLARAMGLMLTGEAVDAEAAERQGLIWRAVDDDRLGKEASGLAESLARGPRAAIASIKRQLRAASVQSLDEALDAERDAQAGHGSHPDYREAVTAFAAKRTPRFA